MAKPIHAEGNSLLNAKCRMRIKSDKGVKLCPQRETPSVDYVDSSLKEGATLPPSRGWLPKVVSGSKCTLSADAVRSKIQPVCAIVSIDFNMGEVL